MHSTEDYVLRSRRDHTELFQLFRENGWNDSWRADPLALSEEPYWRENKNPITYPRHKLATELLQKFHRLAFRVGPRGGKGFQFGCFPPGNAILTELKNRTVPGDIERYLLKSEPTSQPAYPIAELGDWMFYVLPDASAVAMAFNWRYSYVGNDFFGMLEIFLLQNGDFRRLRELVIDDLDDVPPKMHSMWEAG